MTDLAVLVPVLNRPHRVKPFLKSLEESVSGCRVVFVVDPDDLPETQAVLDAGCWPLKCDGGYAAKINEAVRATTESLLFLAADDLDPKPGWLKAAKARIHAGAHVVGVNDLLDRPHRPQHATHFLVTREYAQVPCVDGSRGPLYEGYSHWFTDDEFIATATRRGVYAYADDSHVEHLHAINGKAPDDSTYRLGRARRREDGTLFRRRRRAYL